MAKNWLTTGEVAKMIGVNPSTVVAWAEEGEIPVGLVTPGGHRRFRESDVAEFYQKLISSTYTGGYHD